MIWIVLAAAVGVVIWRDPLGPGRRGVKEIADAGGSPIAVAIDAAPEAIVDAAPVIAAADAAVEIEPDAPTAPPLYTVDEALADLRADKLVFVGTGAWFGNFSIHACAYRNARVIVVNVYCTAKEQPALGLVVLSPTRGRLMIYAEADKPISTLRRSEYMQFRAEVQPPIADHPLSLTLGYAELNAWEERRYHASAPACWMESGRPGCSKGLDGRLDAWAASAKTFLDGPPDSWYALAKDLHARAVRDSSRAR